MNVDLGNIVTLPGSLNYFNVKNDEQAEMTRERLAKDICRLLHLQQPLTSK